MRNSSETSVFTITLAWLDQNVNEGAVNAKQLRAIGQSWPPPQGWMHRLVGLEITNHQKYSFEAFRKKKERDNLRLFA